MARGGLIGFAIVLALLAAACSDEWDPAATEPALPPNILEMDVSSPEAVLDHAIAAWQDGDFELLSRLLTADARGRMLINLELDGVSTDTDQIGFELRDVNSSSHEHIREMFVGAAIAGTLPIDLSEGVRDRATEQAGDEATIRGRLGDGTSVIATLWAQENGEWRLHQIRTTDGDRDVVPFSAPAGGEPAPRTPRELTSTDTMLPTGDPASLAVVILRLVEVGDFPRLSYLFDRPALVQLQASSPAAFTTPAGRDIVADLSLQHRWGGLWSAIWTEAVALDAMYVDPEGPYGVVSVTMETGLDLQFRDGDAVVVTVTDRNDVAFEVRLLEVEPGVHQLLQVLEPGGDPHRYPFSGPTGIVATPGTEVCWDHTRYDCDEDFDRNLIPAYGDLRAEIDAGTIDDADGFVRLQEFENLISRLPAMCAAMQGSVDVERRTFPVELVDIAPLVVEHYCPGDPALLVVG